MTAEYRVHLEAFEGPLDLLLYLIRRSEVDIHDIPVSTIADQYLRYLEAFDLDRVDIEVAGDFLVMATTLMEIKSRVLAREALRDPNAPESPVEPDEPDPEDPRLELVRQLMEYRKYRDAADALEARRADWERTHPAAAAAVDDEKLRESLEELRSGAEVEELDLGELVIAYRRIAATVNFDRLGEHEVIADDTPIELYSADLCDRLARDGGDAKEMSLVTILEGRPRREMLGLFLAMLDLIKDQKVKVRQEGESFFVALREDAEFTEPEPTVQPEPQPEEQPEEHPAAVGSHDDAEAD